jgi:hypothetical protein
MAVLFCIHVISSRLKLPCGNMNRYQNHCNNTGIIKIMFKKVLAIYWDIPVLCCYVSCVGLCHSQHLPTDYKQVCTVWSVHIYMLNAETKNICLKCHFITTFHRYIHIWSSHTHTQTNKQLSLKLTTSHCMCKTYTEFNRPTYVEITS